MSVSIFICFPKSLVQHLWLNHTVPCRCFKLWSNIDRGGRVKRTANRRTDGLFVEPNEAALFVSVILIRDGASGDWVTMPWEGLGWKVYSSWKKSWERDSWSFLRLADDYCNLQWGSLVLQRDTCLFGPSDMWCLASLRNTSSYLCPLLATSKAVPRCYIKNGFLISLWWKYLDCVWLLLLSFHCNLMRLWQYLSSLHRDIFYDGSFVSANLARIVLLARLFGTKEMER